MPVYRVSFFMTQEAHTNIEAESEEDAKEIFTAGGFNSWVTDQDTKEIVKIELTDL